jgi:mannose-1-phosphate guanylyltransferase
LNGDIFCNLNYKELLNKHKQSNATATIALYRVEDPSRFGVAELGENSQIKRFIEKPAKGTAPTNYINAGIYALNPQIFQYIPKGQAVSMERDVFPKLAAEGKLFGHIFQGQWMDIGKPDEYLAANNAILDSLQATLKTPKISHSELNTPVAIDSRVSIGKKSAIGPYATIGKNTVIGQGTQIRNSIIFPHASIGDFCIIEGAIIGEGVVIGKNVKLKGCIVADHAKVGGNLEIKERLTVCPGKVVTETF